MDTRQLGARKTRQRNYTESEQQKLFQNQIKSAKLTAYLLSKTVALDYSTANLVEIKGLLRLLSLFILLVMGNKIKIKLKSDFF